MAKKKSIFEGSLEKEGVETKKQHSHDDFLEPEEHEESADEVEQKMHAGEKGVDVYSEEGREELVEGDEISEREEGFSEGAEGKGDPHVGHSAEQHLTDNPEKKKFAKRSKQTDAR
jgi:hypothetical protein